MKTIFGVKTHTSDALKTANIPTLEEISAEIFKKFTIKTAANPAYERWFPVHFPYRYELRQKKKIPRDKSPRLSSCTRALFTPCGESLMN